MILTYALDKETSRPLYEQLYCAIRDDILSGNISGGERLPSKRALAEHLNVSKITVENAYAQLLSEGYISSKERSGYFAEQFPEASTAGFSERTEAVLTEKPRQETSRPSQALFPFSVWAKLMRTVLLDRSEELLQPVPPQGLLALRQMIAKDLSRRRGMTVLPQQIFIGAGAEYFYNLLVQFFGFDHPVALEALGHKNIQRVYAANGVKTVPIGLDNSGIIVPELEASGAEILHFSPSHHYPTGIVTPAFRRQQILSWLRADPARFIIEDDYDSEFRFSGRPIPTLQSMDSCGRVIYINTFSKTITPALRISYMILPLPLLDKWQQKLGFYSCSVPSFEQLTLTRFLADGYFERHLNRMKKHYRQVRLQLLLALSKEPICRFCTAQNADAGLHFMLQFHTGFSDEALSRKLKAAGLDLPPLSSFCVRPEKLQEAGCFILNYADLDPDNFSAALQRFTRSLEAENKKK